ncbi:MAG: hypothetical protein VZR27_03910 [Acutalibacteraceae bacterium]|nr:hypothetical protein [Acutalibacteraceae bacterium]
MKWIKNIENIAKINSPGNCPYCENSDTEYTAVRIYKNLGYAVVWCNKCKRACNISRMEITDKTIVGKTIPKNLIFTTM